MKPIQNVFTLGDTMIHITPLPGDAFKICATVSISDVDDEGRTHIEGAPVKNRAGLELLKLIIGDIYRADIFESKQSSDTEMILTVQPPQQVGFAGKFRVPHGQLDPRNGQLVELKPLPADLKSELDQEGFQQVMTMLSGCATDEAKTKAMLERFQASLAKREKMKTAATDDQVAGRIADAQIQEASNRIEHLIRPALRAVAANGIPLDYELADALIMALAEARHKTHNNGKNPSVKKEKAVETMVNACVEAISKAMTTEADINAGSKLNKQKLASDLAINIGKAENQYLSRGVA